MINKRSLLVLAGLLVLFVVPLATPSPVYACLCQKPASVDDALAEAEVVFVGKVTTVEEQKAKVGEDQIDVTLRSAVFEVTSIYKGEVGPKAVVSDGRSDCDAHFESGLSYIVFAIKYPVTSPEHSSGLPNFYEANTTGYGDRLYSSQCSGSDILFPHGGQSWVQKQGWLQELGSGRPPGAIDSSIQFERSITTIVVLALGISAVLVFLLLRQRRKSTQ